MRSSVVVFGFALTLIFSQTNASDHIDGPVTTKHRVADLTDLYAYPTPNKPGFLSLILNAYPLVSRSGHFTDKVNYTFIFRHADINRKSDPWSISTSDEISINCTFKTPNVVASHLITCRSSNGLFAENTYGIVQAAKVGNDFAVYSGMRSDPFFFDADFAKDLSTKGKLRTKSGKNVMKGTNVLSIVLEVEARKLFPRGDLNLLAIATEATTADLASDGGLRRLDRIGRPEITNVSLVARENASELRDEYNTSRPFTVSAEQQSKFQQRLFENIGHYDNSDKVVDWKDDKLKMNLAKILADDFLLLDINKSCTSAAFLDIEMATVKKQSYATCGGRRPNDDIMDIMYGLYVAGFSGKKISDGVDQPDQKVSDTFPYLFEPDLSLTSRAKQFIAKKVLGIRDDEHD